MGHRWFGSSVACMLALALACSGKTADSPGAAGAGGSDSSATAGSAAIDAAGSTSAGATSAAAAGQPSSGGAASAGAPGAGGSATGGAPSAGSGGASAGSGGASAGSGGAPSMAGTSSGGGGGLPPLPDPSDALKVKPSLGCGKDPMQASAAFVKYTIQTSGIKGPDAADSTKGPWSYPRDYYAWLPPSYDTHKAYPLVLQAPGCGGTGLDVYSLSASNDNVGVGVNGSVIRVGLTPPPNAIGHATNPNQGCFDDHEGDDSVEWPFYEALIDKLKSSLCYDENRVFVSGSESGATLANELACKYAGNTAGYAVRGIAARAGALPTSPQYVPNCSTGPLAGIWLMEVNANPNLPVGYETAVARALKVNHCTASSFAEATLLDFPIGASKPQATCKKLLGCPAEYPLVVCVIPGNGSSGDNDTVNPAFSTFLSSLEAP